MKKNNIQDQFIYLKNGLKIEHHHEQDCCESVYAEFKALKDTTFEDEQFSSITIETVKGSGFRINGYFVPCYNSQNGYYSDNLKLIFDTKYIDCDEIEIYFDNKLVFLPKNCQLAIDITHCNKDNIN